MPLAPCPQCARHVRLPTSPCPFCGGDTTLARPARAWRVTSSRFTRAAIFAGAALMASCSEAEEPPAASAAQEAAPTPEPAPVEDVQAEPDDTAMQPVTPELTEDMEAEPATDPQAAVGSAEDQDEEEAQAASVDERRRRRRRRVVEEAEEAIEDIRVPIAMPYGAPPLREDWPV